MATKWYYRDAQGVVVSTTSDEMRVLAGNGEIGLFTEVLARASSVLAKELNSDFERPASWSWNWYPDRLEEYARRGARGVRIHELDGSAARPSWQFSLTEMLAIVTGGSVGMAFASLIPPGHLWEVVGVALVLAIPTLCVYVAAEYRSDT
jgi:hypothetical protein